MKGLILKDYYELRNQFGLIIPLILLYMLASQFMDNTIIDSTYFLVGMITMLLAMLPTSTFAFDENSGWDQYGLTMNITRKQIVDAKYAVIWITAGLIFVADLLVLLLYGESFGVAATLAFVFAGLTLPVNGIMTPAIFKWGCEKGRMVLMALVLIPIFGAPLIPSDLSTITFTPQLLIGIGVGVLFLFFGVITLSYFLSLHIYKKRDI